MKSLFRYVWSLLLVFTSLSLSAQIPNGYYNNAEGKTGDDLKVALHEIIKGHKTVSYNGLWTAYAYTDCKPNGKIWDMYSNYEFTYGNTCGEYAKEGDCYNREHTWPQSWFNEETTPRCDLFHVVPTDGYVNNRRGNYPYGEVTRPTYTSGNGSKLGPCATTGYSGTVFEPIDEYKGDIARGFFYMSVRYYGEDSGWGTSGMTNKSEILPWAMDMLLRWSDDDPVSQKELDRNNAVYGYQNNRNPFIDHPEYARMIWDETWQGTTFTVTCNPSLHGNVMATPTSAFEGQPVTLSAIPEIGYVLSNWTAIDAQNHPIAIANGQFIMPASNVTVSASFAIDNTNYNVITSQPAHGTIHADVNSALSGQTVTLTATPESSYLLRNWSVTVYGSNTSIPVTNNQFVMPAADVVVTASFGRGNSVNSYIKVTSTTSNWTGNYLIVNEEAGVAFNGSLTSLDVAANTIPVTIHGDTIDNSGNMSASSFNFVDNQSSCTIQSASGYYIGATSDANGLASYKTNQYTNSVGLDPDNNIDIVSTKGPHLRYNSQSDQKRFRFYKSTTYTSQKPIQLYRLVYSNIFEPHVVYFHGNGGNSTVGDSYSQNIEDDTPTNLTECSFSRQGFRFAGWNTQANGEGSYFVDEATVSLLDDMDLYAMWEPLYSITCSSVPHGSIHADKTCAIEDETVTLSATPNPGYVFYQWLVIDSENNTICVTENQFDMPAHPVTVSAVFAPSMYCYLKVTSDLDDWTGNYLIVNTYNNNSVAFDGSRTTLDAVSNTIAVDIQNGAIEFNASTSASSFDIVDCDTACTIRSASGYYIGATSDANGLTSHTTTRYYNRINLGDSYNVNIVSTKGPYLRYNSQSGQNRFRFYKSSSYTTLGPIQLYRKVEIATAIPFVFTNATDDNWSNPDNWNTHSLPGATAEVMINGACHLDVDATVTSAFVVDGCSLTIDEDKVLSAEEMFSDTITKLFIEEGGQLITNSDAVMATVKKSIILFDDHTVRWNLVAAPTVAPSVSLFAHEDFDLYAYNEAQASWLNSMETALSVIEEASGYLYANGTSSTIYFSGMLISSSSSVEIPLSYQFEGDLAGFNLVGNPFPCNATIDRPFYVLNADRNALVEGNGTIAPCEAVFVKASSTGQKVTFTRVER